MTKTNEVMSIFHALWQSKEDILIDNSSARNKVRDAKRKIIHCKENSVLRDVKRERERERGGGGVLKKF